MVEGYGPVDWETVVEVAEGGEAGVYGEEGFDSLSWNELALARFEGEKEESMRHK